MRKKKSLSLRELRLAAGLSIERLSVSTGIAYSVIQALEIGRGRNFSAGAKHMLAHFFKVDPLALFPELEEQIAALAGTGRKVQIQEFVGPEDPKKGGKNRRA